MTFAETKRGRPLGRNEKRKRPKQLSPVKEEEKQGKRPYAKEEEKPNRISHRCYLGGEQICFNCQRQNHAGSDDLRFCTMERAEINTRRPFCLFTANDVRDDLFVFCRSCKDYLRKKALIEVGPYDWFYIWYLHFNSS